MLRILLLLSLISFTYHYSYGQKFSAALLFGMNASQINGDDHAGYNKIGLTGGAKLIYPLQDKLDMNIEFLFSQRGSRASSDSPIINDFKIHLNYAEIPLFISYHDWYIEDENYYKVSADLGFSYARLISSTTSESTMISGIEQLKDNDVSFLLGARYRFNKSWAGAFRYTKSINKLYKDMEFPEHDLKGYFITLRAEFYL